MTTPNLTDYDYIIINTSAGKDSQSMMEYVVKLADEAGVRDRLVAVHADLGRMEWEGTKELAATQSAYYGLRFEVVSRPQGDLLTHIKERGMWPSSTTRYCTSDHKRDQVAKIITKLSRESSMSNIKILNCMGLRAEESPARAKRADFSINKRLSNKSRTVHEWLPIHAWKETEVWASIKASKVPYHRAYDLGMPRLSCIFCIFAPKSALVLAGTHNRELLEEYVGVEAEMGHKFRMDTSMAEVKEAVVAGTHREKIASWSM